MKPDDMPKWNGYPIPHGLAAHMSDPERMTDGNWITRYSPVPGEHIGSALIYITPEEALDIFTEKLDELLKVNYARTTHKQTGEYK